MDIDNLAIIIILMIKSRFVLDRLLLLSISNKRGFTAPFYIPRNTVPSPKENTPHGTIIAKSLQRNLHPATLR